MRQVGQVCCLWNQERRQLWRGRGVKYYKNVSNAPQIMSHLYRFVCGLLRLSVSPGVENVITR